MGFNLPKFFPPNQTSCSLYLPKLFSAKVFYHTVLLDQGRIEGGFLGFQETPFDSKTFLK